MYKYNLEFINGNTKLVITDTPLNTEESNWIQDENDDWYNLNHVTFIEFIEREAIRRI